MLKEEHLEHQKGQKDNGKKKEEYIMGDYLHELYKSYLMLETKIITPFYSQDNNT